MYHFDMQDTACLFVERSVFLFKRNSISNVWLQNSNEKFMQNFGWEIGRRKYLGDLGVDGIIIDRSLGNRSVGVDWINLARMKSSGGLL
jgi:hypothetical protein